MNLHFANNSKHSASMISFLKDEGKDGDRDFIQWDTVSLMSLLGVYVILGYYKDAKKNSTYSHKITDQEFDYDYIKDRLDGLSQYKLDALHWNLNELNKNLLSVAKFQSNSRDLAVSAQNREYQTIQPKKV